MTRHWLWWVISFCASCGAQAPAPRIWTLGDFGKVDKDFGGFSSNLTVTPSNAERFPHLAENIRPGVPVFPAVAGGKPYALVITEIWQHWPTPWIEPVYKSGQTTLFPLGRNSTFYTPFWSAVIGPEGLNSVEAILRRAPELRQRTDTAVYCPLTTPALAQLSSTTVPLTETPLANVPLPQPALVEGDVSPQTYFDFGTNRFTAVNGRPTESSLYLFVDEKGLALPLPFVLPDHPLNHSFFRRIEVSFPQNGAVVVAGRLLSRFAGKLGNVKVLESPQTAGVAPVRVVNNRACLESPGMSATCQWLDSESKILELPAQSRKRTDTTLAGASLEGQ
jgi:hypothetical protein